jgi:hypothetical protein
MEGEGWGCRMEVMDKGWKLKDDGLETMGWCTSFEK